MILKIVTVGMTQANCYIVGCERTRQAAIIDPGAEAGKIKKAILAAGVRPEFIINTHGHADHMGANKDFQLPVMIHCEDADFLADPQKNLSGTFGFLIKSPAANRLLKEKDTIKVGDLRLLVIHTPGHTPGGISLKLDKVVFTGDTLFCGGIGRTDFPYSDEKALFDSIRNKLLILDDDVAIYPGHGPSSTIGRERKNNPYL